MIVLIVLYLIPKPLAAVSGEHLAPPGAKVGGWRSLSQSH